MSLNENGRTIPVVRTAALYGRGPTSDAAVAVTTKDHFRPREIQLDLTSSGGGRLVPETIPQPVNDPVGGGERAT